MRAGEEITVLPAPGVDDEALRLFVTGIALGVILHQRGLLVLHASAVDVAGEAIGFLGGPRWGKSTTAAALYQNGHGFIADDVLALELDGETPRVRPGFPQVKLWPDAAAAVGHEPVELPRIRPTLEKRAARVSRRFEESTRVLRRLYVLEPDADEAVQPLGPQERVIELVRHSYLAALLPTLGGTDEHFRRCAHVAASVPMARLRVPGTLTDLPLLAAAVEADLAS